MPTLACNPGVFAALRIPLRNGFRFIFARPLDEWFTLAYHREEVNKHFPQASQSGRFDAS